MDIVSILAQTAEAAGGSGEAVEGTIVPMEQIWAQITSLGVLEALTFMSFGAVCLFYGWRVFKVLVVISFALLGLLLGLYISDKMGGGDNPLLGVLLSVVLGIVSVPLMRWAVSILGAIAGGLLTAGVWYACKLPEEYIWMGGLVGITGGMISFIVFKIAVMLFSSIGGSGLMIAGVLALLHHYAQTTEQIQELFFGSKWFLPVALAIPTALGILVQNKFIKGSQNWSV